jgi:hypothetical protein
MPLSLLVLILILANLLIALFNLFFQFLLIILKVVYPVYAKIKLWINLKLYFRQINHLYNIIFYANFKFLSHFLHRLALKLNNYLFQIICLTFFFYINFYFFIFFNNKI